MNYRYLGRSGLKVSELCLGTMTFGRETDESTSHAMLDAFVAAGGTFIDTANVYSRGVSESITGRWLARQQRDDLVIATKVRFPMAEGVNDLGLSRKHIMASVHASSQRLQTDYLDVLQVHCWDRGTPLAETLTTLNDLVRQGVVHYIGASNFSGWQLQKALDVSRELGLEAFVSLQPQYNLLCRSTEWELIELCLEEGLGVLPWSPLRGGWLSGKFKRGMEQPPEDSRIAIAGDNGWSESWDNYNNDHTWNVLDALHAVAAETGKHPAQVAVRWVMQRPGVTSPIVGARTMGQLETNLAVVDWELTANHMNTLNEASDWPLPYPYDFISNAQKPR